MISPGFPREQWPFLASSCRLDEIVKIAAVSPWYVATAVHPAGPRRHLRLVLGRYMHPLYQAFADVRFVVVAIHQ